MKKRVEFSPEFDLLVQCCRWNFIGAERAGPAIPPAVDWDRFHSLARFHRVQGFAWQCLGAAGVPPSSTGVKQLEAEAIAIASRNLQIATEMHELARSFETSSTAMRFLKGLPVAALVYDKPLLKASVDIDILVNPDELHQASTLLSAHGYRLIEPAGDAGALHAWHSNRKDSEWERQGPTLRVDLHTRLADNPRLLAGLNASAPSQSADLGQGLAFATLATEPLFAHLAVHGASSAWFRLKWLSDFAGLLFGLESARIEQIYRRSEAFGAARAAGQALLLADALFDSLAALPHLRSELAAQPATQCLFRAALGQLAQPDPVEPTATRLGTATIHWTQFLLREGLAFKLSELSRQVRAAIA